MPSRNQAMTRRDINRLDDCCQQFGPQYPALAALAPLVHAQAEAVNTANKNYIDALAKRKREGDQRDQAFDNLHAVDGHWRPLVFLSVPGSEATLHVLPPQGATIDDMIHYAGDLVTFIQNNPGTEKFRKAAVAELEPAIATAKKETGDATTALPDKHAARAALTAACVAALPFVVHGSEIVRSIFGPTSPQYKQFIAHDHKEAASITADAQAGEVGTDNGSAAAQSGDSAGATS